MLLILDAPGIDVRRWSRMTDEPLEVVDLHERLATGVAAEPGIFVKDPGAYEFYRLEDSYRGLADDWASGAVRALQDVGAFPPYQGVDLAPPLHCWLFNRLLPAATLCARLARVVEVEDSRAVRVVTESGLRAGLFERFLEDRGIPGRVIRVDGGARVGLAEAMKPVVRMGRDAMRLVAAPAAPGMTRRRRRVMFLYHGPASSAHRSLFAAFTRRGWELALLNMRDAANRGGIQASELCYEDYLPGRAGTARIYWYLLAFWSRTTWNQFGDLPGAVPFPLRLWRALVRDAVYALVTDVELLRQALRSCAPDLLMYTNRGAFGNLACGVARPLHVPTMWVQLTEMFRHDVLRHIRADWIAVLGEAYRELFVRAAVASADRVIVVGSDHRMVSEGVARADARAKVRQDLGLRIEGGGEKVVLYASQPQDLGKNPDSYRRLVFQSVAAAVVALPEVRLVVKLHPREQDAGVAECFGRYLGNGRLAITKDYDLGVLLDASDAVLIQWSTVGLQAITRGKPVIVLHYKGGGSVVSSPAEGAALCVEKSGDLAAVLRSVLQEASIRDVLRRNSQMFLERHMFRNDGRGSERIVDLAESIVSVPHDRAGRHAIGHRLPT